DVDVARLQRRETLRETHRSRARPIRAAEKRHGDGTAEIGLQALPLSLVVDLPEAEITAGRSAAEQLPACLDRLDRRTVCKDFARRHEEDERAAREGHLGNPVHKTSPSIWRSVPIRPVSATGFGIRLRPRSRGII